MLVFLILSISSAAVLQSPATPKIQYLLSPITPDSTKKKEPTAERTLCQILLRFATTDFSQPPIFSDLLDKFNRLISSALAQLTADSTDSLQQK